MGDEPRWWDYDEASDLDAVVRIWREVGWIDDSDRERDGLSTFFSGGSALVAGIDGAGPAECAVHATPGTYRHDGSDVALWAITGVTTSRIGRNLGLATELMAEALARGAESGAVVATLGMFEQGYYDRFGFGADGYDHEYTLDPDSLDVPMPDRVPVRLGREDAAELHDLLARRHRTHGGVALSSPTAIAAELAWTEHLWALGWRDPQDGRLVAAVAGDAKDEHGPYSVDVLAAEDPADVVALLGLVRSLGDQVRSVTFRFEPADLQLQDHVRHPIRAAQRRGLHRVGAPNAALCWRQTRILDVEAALGCLDAASWRIDPAFSRIDPAFGRTDPASGRHGGAGFACALKVTDPLADRGGRWPGVGGTYRWVLPGNGTSTAEAVDGDVGDLPVVRVSVNALSQLWSGARSASALALRGVLRADGAAVAALDRAIRLPTPRAGLLY